MRAARGLIGGSNVHIDVVEIGSCGRAVARLEAGGSNLGALLIQGSYG